MKIFFSVLGLCSFGYIVYDFGLSRLIHDLYRIGFWSIPLMLSFFPVIFLYALAWLLVTPEAKASALPRFVRFSIISVAWNNLSPFIKVLGEHMRVKQIEERFDKKTALKSVLLYNLVHIYGTVAAFGIGAILIPLVYTVPDSYRAGFWGLVLASLVIIAVLYFSAKVKRRKKRVGRAKRKINWRTRMSYGFNWSLSKVRVFARLHPWRFCAAIFLEIVVRFVEGLTFFIAFYALGSPLLPLDAALLDVGRALFDNLFFFIPYQVGSREGTVMFFTDRVMQRGAEVAVSAAILYRVVEIFWTGFGYFLWISGSKSRKRST